MIYCPRCDKPITPDHRCLSRRHFFGMLAGAAAAAAALGSAGLSPGLRLRRGDVLSVTSVLAAQIEAVRSQLERAFYATVDLVDNSGQRSSIHCIASNAPTPVFIAPRDYTITGARAVSGTAYVGPSVTLQIRRSPK